MIDSVKRLWNCYESLIESLWLIIIFLLPLFFNPLSHHAFYLNKALLLQLLVSILLGLVIAQWLIGKKDSTESGLKQDMRLVALFMAALMLGITWIVSTLFSIDPSVSFLGNLPERNGTITLIVWIIFFIILLVKIRSLSQVYDVLYALLLSSALVAVMGITQSINPQSFSWFAFNGRVFSTIGNPLVLSGFIAMVMPITIAMMIIKWKSSENKVRKTVILSALALVLIAQSWCLCLAQYSVTILLFIIGIVVFCLLSGILTRTKWMVVVAGIVTVVLIAVASLLVGQLFIQHNTDIRGNIENNKPAVAEQIGLDTLERRILFWASGIELIDKTPAVPFSQNNNNLIRKLFGYGSGNYAVAAQSTYPQQLKSEDTYNSMLLGQPENHYLYLCVTTGILGLLAMLTLIVISIMSAISIFRRVVSTEKAFLTCAFLSVLIQYCAHIFFNPSNISLELCFWVVLALIGVNVKLQAREYSQGENYVAVNTSVDKQASFPENDKVREVVSIGVALCLLFVGCGLTVRTFVADMQLQRALNLWDVNRDESMAAFTETVIIQPDESIYRSYLAYYAYINGVLHNDDHEKQIMMEYSVSSYDNAYKLEPYLSYWNYMEGDVYTYWAGYLDATMWPYALYQYESADALSPGNAVILNKWALALILQGDYDAAGQKLVESYSADPNWAQTKFISGLLKIIQNQEPVAEKYFVKPIIDSPANVTYFVDFCRQMALFNKIDFITTELENYKDSNPDNWMGFALLGTVDTVNNKLDAGYDNFIKAAEQVKSNESGQLIKIIELTLRNVNINPEKYEQILQDVAERINKR